MKKKSSYIAVQVTENGKKLCLRCKGFRKRSQKQTVAAIKSGDFSEVEKIEDAARQEAAKVFLAVASGSVPLIWYALHRSTKQDGFLQLSCMELKSGQIIPTSDRQYNTTDGGFSEFFRDLPRSVNANFLEQ